jgi:hypothetical protein
MFINGGAGVCNFYGTASACSPNPCEQPGACCDAYGSCRVGYAFQCSRLWTLHGTCAPNVCPTESACCRLGGVCIVTTAADCHGPVYVGAACLTPGYPALCCPADFNGDGVLGVADVFAFMNAWLVQDPRANWDGYHPLTIASLFSFISMWFNGC